MSNQSHFPFSPATKPRARASDPQTSVDAAVSMDATEHRRLILLALKAGDGNYTEVAARTGLDRHAVGRRLRELQREGLIVATGEHRLTPSNRRAMVWRAV